MRNLGTIGLGILAMVFLWAMPVQTAEAADGYKYDSSTNTYIIEATSGNITEDVNDALDAMVTSTKKLGTLVIQPGSYEVNLINLKKSNVTITAEGATLKFMGSNVNGQYLVKCTNSTIKNVTIEGGTWDGNKKASNVFGFSGLGTKAGGITIQDCKVKNSIDANIRVNNGQNIVVKNVTTTNTEYGIYIEKATDVTLEKVQASACEVGVDLRKLNGTNSIKNTTVEKCTRVGMQIKDQPTVITMTGGSCNNNYAGISLTTGAKLTMKEVDVSNNKSNGISPVGNRDKKTVLNIYNSSFNNNGRHGVAGANYVEIYAKDSEMNGNSSNGVMLRDYCSSKGLINLTTNKNKMNGILIQGKSTCSKISGCVAMENGTNGLMLMDISTTLNKVTASKNKGCGVYNFSASTKTVTVTNSEISSNKSHGLSVSEKAGYAITKTTIQKNQVSGVESNGGTIKISGSGNKIANNKKYGVCMRAINGKTGKLYVSKATISKNGASGVYFYGNVTGYCINSKVTDNQNGILVAEGAKVSKLTSNTITNNTQYGIAVYRSKNGKTTTLTECKSNTLNNPGATKEIMYWTGTKVPNKLVVSEPIAINNTVKAGKTKVTGNAVAGCEVVVTANGKKYNAKKVAKNGIYSVKVAKLKAGKTVKVIITDSYKNKIMTQKKL